MNEEIRVERRVSVTEKITPSAARNLYALSHSETWPDLLDVLERCCIEIESALISVDVKDTVAVLENHKLSKAAWVIFGRMQERIIEAGNAYWSEVATQPVVPRLTPEEQEREYTLNPTNYPDLPDDALEN
jgi:L-rhamnose mutarotase